MVFETGKFLLLVVGDDDSHEKIMMKAVGMEKCILVELISICKKLIDFCLNAGAPKGAQFATHFRILFPRWRPIEK
jgi:hypothetical protein